MCLCVHILKYIHIHGVHSFLFTDILKGSFCPFNLKSFSSNITFLIKCNCNSLQPSLPRKNPKNQKTNPQALQTTFSRSFLAGTFFPGSQLFFIALMWRIVPSQTYFFYLVSITAATHVAKGHSPSCHKTFLMWEISG